MNEVLRCIYERSSVRKYKSDIVSDADIKEILNAGIHAPSGMNAQGLRFVIIQNTDMIAELNRVSKDLYLKNSAATGGGHPVLDKICSNPKTDLFHGASTLIFTFAAPDTATPTEDGALAVENMMLAAHSMGYGTCFIGLAAPLGYYPTFREESEVPDDHMFLSCIVLGVPDGKPEVHPKEDMKILSWTK
ncbi:MAG: nitroreductase [Candidatus Methanomethylophilaceae archaeon]|nr:nitroreductase [Candidatus Methanomethylophilaceae archaeon]MDD3378592.1 nitroreductase [Candidatus Methanomethylophilaceae archaeon]